MAVRILKVLCEFRTTQGVVRNSHNTRCRAKFAQHKVSCEIFAQAWSGWLPKAISSSFRLQIVHGLKCWILDFLSFEMLAGYSSPLGAPPRLAPPVPPQVEQAQQDELPTESVPPAPVPPMPKATSTTPPTIPDQHTTILHQIQQHIGLLPPPQPDIPRPSEPIAPVEETTPTEETTRADVPIQRTQEVATDPSSSHDP
ncbi:hypothetical protein CK203_107866 [Vitis vinifera]|uniref:Uncharacterized protein n=1 Tax=Vitis vinifera TaxID=29760 RepID=A0A438CIA1_VITVI|nr:hypothetical protein CK203_107866 [Vitis vinifera]